ncbi:MAG TPA: alpha/beta hydrolase [Planctomycetota bacterium]|nr:alpha/beta hydrolase [Planctomycetota bacterium]
MNLTLSSWYKPALRLGLLLVLICFVLSTDSCQNKLFLFPSKMLANTPESRQIPFEEVTFNNPKGIKLHGWYFPAENAIGTVVLNHGNAGNIGIYLDYAAMFTKAGANLLLYDYQGFGKSEGSPSIRSLEGDALAAFDYLAARGNNGGGIAVMGVSLGTPISCIVTAKRPAARGLILEGAFVPRDELYWHMGTLGTPIAFIISRTMPDMRPEVDIKSMAGRPILMVHGSSDRTTPIVGAAKLFEQAPNPKWLWVMEDLGHFSEPVFYKGTQYRRVISEFVRAVFAGEEFPQPQVVWSPEKRPDGTWSVKATVTARTELPARASMVAVTEDNKTQRKELRMDTQAQHLTFDLGTRKRPVTVSIFAEPAPTGHSDHAK